MDGAGNRGRVAGASWRAGVLHSLRVSAEQRLHRAAVLILLLLAVPMAAQDFVFDPDISDEDFHRLSAIVGQAIYASPVEPASIRGFLAFDVGVAATAVPIDDEASYWVNS